MCCLFGFVDYGHKLSRKQRHRLLTVLSACCEERGTDATGISYNWDGKQHVYKRPLPTPTIETDSYVAVQLLERFDAVDFQGLQFMAEQLEGTFTITALTEKNELYIVKGNNPMCI